MQKWPSHQLVMRIPLLAHIWRLVRALKNNTKQNVYTRIKFIVMTMVRMIKTTMTHDPSYSPPWNIINKMKWIIKKKNENIYKENEDVNTHLHSCIPYKFHDFCVCVMLFTVWMVHVLCIYRWEPRGCDGQLTRGLEDWFCLQHGTREERS